MSNTKKNAIIISKFGGTSMGDNLCMQRSAGVVLDQNSNIVVVSATTGTTNDLIDLARTAERNTWENAHLILTKIKVKTFHRNLGFTGAVNFGMEYFLKHKGKYLLLLNMCLIMP